jgi:thiamine biosynthesis lipoprotein
MSRRFQQSNHGLGSDILLTLVVSDDYPNIDQTFAKLWDDIAKFEKRFSRFLEDSELSKFNARAGEKFELSPQFIDLLKVSKELSFQTGGLFNPFILPVLQKVGYIGSWPNTDKFADAINYESRDLISIESLEIGKNLAKIPKNSAIDFGGIGKGYLLDLLSEEIPEGVLGYWFSIGGDLVCWGKDLDNDYWKIYLQSAVSIGPEQYVRNDDSKKMAVATSGVTKRKGTRSGQAWHHIINPKTGRVAETDVLTATVIANKAYEADVYAKCLVILGSKNSVSFIKENNIRTTSLQIRGKSGSLVTISTGDLNQ